MECYLQKNKLGSLRDYIRHTKTWSILDGVVSFDFTRKDITCFASIDSESVFYEPEYGGIYSYTGFEFIAQTCGVYYGLASRLLDNREPKRGFVLRVNNLQCFDCIIPVGKTALIYATEAQREGAFAYFDGTVSVDDKPITKATLMLTEAE